MNTSSICYNCSLPLTESDKYCPQCGQKTNSKALDLKELLFTFWNSLFNLDNTFFKTLKYIWAPWRLTTFYVEGRRRSLLNPVRLFMITLLFHFGYLVSLTHIDNITTKSFNEYSELEKSKLYEKYLKVKGTQDLKNTTLHRFCDSLEKSLFLHVNTPDKDTFKIENNFSVKEYPITRKDAIELPIDTIFSKYNITAFTDKILTKQMIRMNLDRAGTLKYAIGNCAWGVLVVVLLISFLFKLLYIRHHKPYVEHLVFWMNVHSSSFIFITLTIVMSRFMTDEDTAGSIIAIVACIILPLYLFLSLLYYYKQSKLKTFAKFFLTSLFYLMIGAFVIALVSALSLIFF